MQQQQLLLEAPKLGEMQMPSNSPHYSREGKNEMCTIYLKYDMYKYVCYREVCPVGSNCTFQKAYITVHTPHTLLMVHNLIRSSICFVADFAVKSIKLSDTDSFRLHVLYVS